MIYRCWGCGWRINERQSNMDQPENIGKHILYEHKPFCSDFCIRTYQNFKIKPITAPISNWDEIETGQPGDINYNPNWKTLRKINRKKFQLL
jgi:hypothetical protein